jgi:hypothetical protein
MNGDARANGPGGEVAVYESRGGEVRVGVRLDRETVWPTQGAEWVALGIERKLRAAEWPLTIGSRGILDTTMLRNSGRIR